MEEYIPTPPDGGWGWVVVFASLLGNFIVDGIAYGFGVFLVPLVKAFNVSGKSGPLSGHWSRIFEFDQFNLLIVAQTAKSVEPRADLQEI